MTDPKVTQKIYQKKFRRFLFTTILLAACAGYYCFQLFDTFTKTSVALAQEQETLVTLERTVNVTAQTYSDTKKAFDESFKPVRESIQKVYPSGEDYRELTRLLDAFCKEHNTPANRMSCSDLKYPPARVEANNNYAILPATLTFTSSQENFFEFLNFVHNSGALEEKTRLMDIKSIQINFVYDKSAGGSGASVQNPEKPLLNVSIALNAYFQKPSAAENPKKPTPQKAPN